MTKISSEGNVRKPKTWIYSFKINPNMRGQTVSDINTLRSVAPIQKLISFFASLVFFLILEFCYKIILPF